MRVANTLFLNVTVPSVLHSIASVGPNRTSAGSGLALSSTAWLSGGLTVTVLGVRASAALSSVGFFFFFLTTDFSVLLSETSCSTCLRFLFRTSLSDGFDFELETAAEEEDEDEDEAADFFVDASTMEMLPFETKLDAGIPFEVVGGGGISVVSEEGEDFAVAVEKLGAANVFDSELVEMVVGFTELNDGGAFPFVKSRGEAAAAANTADALGCSGANVRELPK